MTVTRTLSSVSSDAGTWVIRLGEDAGLRVATELHVELESVVDRQARRVIVELAGTSPVDSTVLGVLLAGLRRLERAGAELVLVASGGLSTGTAVDSLHLDRFFRIERSLAEALGGDSRSVRRAVMSLRSDQREP
jgi:anti-anti-sigma regulatory factor